MQQAELGVHMQVHVRSNDNLTATGCQLMHLTVSDLQVWAYANLGYDPGALMDAVAQSSEYRMREFSPQNISNILWAYAKLGMLR